MRKYHYGDVSKKYNSVQTCVPADSNTVFLFVCLNIYLFYLFIFGCIGSLLWHARSFCCSARALSCGVQVFLSLVVVHRLQSA